MSSVGTSLSNNLQALASRTRAVELSQVNSELYARVDSQMLEAISEKRARRGVEAANQNPLVFSVPISKGLRQALPQLFPGLSHVFLNFSSPIASDLEALRQGMTQSIFSAARGHGTIVHVGGMPYMHAPYGRSVHCEYVESTLVAVKAAVVADAIFESMYKEAVALQDLLGPGAFPMALYASTVSGEGKHRCVGPETCTVRANYIVFDLVASPMSQEQVVCAMVQHRCEAAEGFFLFEEQSYHGSAGVVPATEVRASYHAGQIFYDSHYGRPYFPPVFRDDLHAWVSRAIFYVGGICAMVELHEEIGAFRRFSIELLPRAMVPADTRIFHRQWTRSEVDSSGRPVEYYILRSPELRSVGHNPRDLRSYVVSRCKLRKDTFEDCLASALAVERTQMTHAFVRKKLSNLNNRFVVKGTTVEVNVPLEPQVIAIASKVIYLVAYEARRDSTQALAAYAANLDVRSLMANDNLTARVSRAMWAVISNAQSTVPERMFGGVHDFLDGVIDRRSVPTAVAVDPVALYIDHQTYVRDAIKTGWFGAGSASVMLGWPGARLYSVLVARGSDPSLSASVREPDAWMDQPWPEKDGAIGLDFIDASSPGVTEHDASSSSTSSHDPGEAEDSVRGMEPDDTEVIPSRNVSPPASPVSTVFSRVSVLPTSPALAGNYSHYAGALQMGVSRGSYFPRTEEVSVAETVLMDDITRYEEFSQRMRGRVTDAPGDGVESPVVRRELIPIEDIDNRFEKYGFAPDSAFLTTIVDEYRKVYPKVVDQYVHDDQALAATSLLEVGMEVAYYRAPIEEIAPAPRQVYLSRLPGPARSDMQSASRNVFSGFLKRNADPAMPKISQSETLIDDMVDAFKEKMCRPDVDAIIAQYRDQPVSHTLPNVSEWLRKCSPEKLARVDKFLEETDTLVNEFRLDQHNLMPKGKGKPPLDPKSSEKVAKLQTIVFHDTHVNAFWSVLFMDLSTRFESLLDERRVQVGLRGDPSRVQEFLTAVYPYGDASVRHVQTDISEYDKSQEDRAMAIESRILDMCGFSAKDIDNWFFGQRRKTVKSLSLGIKAIIYFQRSSGIATTALGNVILNMVSAAYLFPKPLCATYRGDDGYAVYAGQTWDENRVAARYAEVVNLTVKQIEQSNMNRIPYFCSAFIVIDDLNRRVYSLPDPIRAVESFSRPLPSDEPKFRERFESAKDRATQWKVSFPIHEYTRMVRVWYNCPDLDVVGLTNALATACSGENAFRTLYDDHISIINTI